MIQKEHAELIMDMLHRMMVHHTLWFREVEHQLGFEEALKAMDEVWGKMRSIALERSGIAHEGGIPEVLLSMSEDVQEKLAGDIAKNWLAQDGLWFQAVERRHGMNDAKRCNDSTWGRFSPFEAWSIKKLLGLGEYPGLEGLEAALPLRMYGKLNRQRTARQEGALILYMQDCRVQSARVRRGLPDYPCKSAGLVEYVTFARKIDSRIRTECLGCPPDEHPADWFCAWRFTIPTV